MRPSSESSLAATTVLAIDDDVSLLEELQITLTDGGYRCLTASNAREALCMLTEHAEIDVVLSDISMPEMGGLSLLEQIRAQLGGRVWLQVVFMTGHATLENAVAALKLHVTDFLLKPIRRDQLLKAIETAASRARRKKQAQQTWQEKALQLAQLGNALSCAAKQLSGNGQLTLAQLPLAEGCGPLKTSVMPSADEKMLTRSDMLALIGLCRLRTRFFSGRLFADPAWAMLLEVLEANLLNQTVPVSNFRLVADTSATTALRRVEELERANYIVRRPDPQDGRRSLVSLTEYGNARLKAYFCALAQQIGQLSSQQTLDSSWTIDQSSTDSVKAHESGPVTQICRQSGI